MRTMAQKYLFVALILLSLPACGSSDDPKKGTLEITIYGEEFIEDVSALDDGWKVKYEKYTVTLTDIHNNNIKFTDDQKEYPINLARNSEGKGFKVVSKEVPVGTYSPSFTIKSVELKGEATKGKVTKKFEWELSGKSYKYSDCETSTKVKAGETSQFQITIHSDHIFFNDLQLKNPKTIFEGYANSDSNNDGHITSDELEKKSAHPPHDSGSVSINNMLDFLKYQIATIGHANGEHHCKLKRI